MQTVNISDANFALLINFCKGRHKRGGKNPCKKCTLKWYAPNTRPGCIFADKPIDWISKEAKDDDI